MGRLRGGQGYRPAFRGACRCFPRSMRERERESSWTAVRAQPDECACCVVPSSILGRTDRVTAPCVLWAWAASLRPGRGRTRREVRRRSRHGQSTRGRSGAPARGTLSYAIAYRSVVPRYRYSGVRQFPIMQSRAQGTTRPRSAFVGADGLHAPSLRGGAHRLPACSPRMREASRQMLLTGVTPPRRSRVRAAAAVAAANSGPIGTHGLQPGVKSGEEMHRSTLQAQKIGRWTAPPVFSHILPLKTACVCTGRVGHTSVHSDSGSCAWGSGESARARAPRCVDQHLSTRPRPWTAAGRGFAPPNSPARVLSPADLASDSRFFAPLAGRCPPGSHATRLRR